MARERGCSVRSGQAVCSGAASRGPRLSASASAPTGPRTCSLPPLPSPLPSPLVSPLMSLLIENHVRNQSKNHVGSSRARELCQNCGHTWPANPEYGTTCYPCQTPRHLAEQRTDDRSQRQRHDRSQSTTPARKEKKPLTPETRAQLETEAIENGYHKRDDGSWTKGTSPSPQQPTTTCRASSHDRRSTEAHRDDA